jgi:hypothetical protein
MGWEGNGNFEVVGGSFGKGVEKGLGGSGREGVGN